MSLRLDIISIGTLDRNLIWKEGTPARTAHATCSLIRVGRRNILIDPGLPGIAIKSRLFERTGILIERVTDVFLTHLSPRTMAGLDVLTHANWLANGTEIDGYKTPADAESAKWFRKIRPADDKLAEGVDLFPLPGPTPGCAGLLLSMPMSTTLLTGPAVATQDHLLQRQVLPDVHNLQQAKESLVEVMQIADIIVPGFDNWFINPRSLGNDID